MVRCGYACSLFKHTEFRFRRIWKQGVRGKLVLLLVAALLGSAVGAWAQNSAPPPGPLAYSSGILPTEWQFSLDYQFNRLDLRGALPSFDTNGVNLSAVRYFGRFLGVEGDEGTGFGSCRPGDAFRSLFLGGGAHLVYHNRTRFEPWAHALIGLSYYNFAGPTLPFKDTALSWVAGGGVDYRIQGGFGLRFEGDYLGTHFGGVYQRAPQVVAGVVWNF